MAIELTILYRGPLSSCNYNCDYCGGRPAGCEDFPDPLRAASGIFWSLVGCSAFWLVVILLIVEAIEKGAR